ncbi:protein of unknown function [Rhizobiales bacterium GAS188]|nr:protein of unknown function [Rhizobiales bacterium GAS188]
MRMATLLIGAQIAAMSCAFGATAMAAGAVVVSPDRSVIYWSTRKPSVEAAVNIAMGKCKARFGSCAVDKSFVSGCLGVALSRKPNVWGFAVRPSANEARSAALGQCEQNGAKCATETVTCE